VPRLAAIGPSVQNQNFGHDFSLGNSSPAGLNLTLCCGSAAAADVGQSNQPAQNS
jgi:hypothetical protein